MVETKKVIKVKCEEVEEEVYQLNKTEIKLVYDVLRKDYNGYQSHSVEYDDLIAELTIIHMDLFVNGVMK